MNITVCYTSANYKSSGGSLSLSVNSGPEVVARIGATIKYSMKNIYKEKIIIGPLAWNIKPLDPKDCIEFDGLCSIPLDAEIFIDKSLRGERAIDVILHECLHAMEHMYDVDLTEETVGKLGNMLGKLFIQNPWLVDYIKQEIKNEEVSMAKKQ